MFTSCAKLDKLSILRGRILVAAGAGGRGGRAEVGVPTLTSRPPPVGAGIAMAGTFSSAHPTPLYTHIHKKNLNTLR